MKKVFALSALLMLGTASQASAYFEAGNFILSVYDTTLAQETGVDLGALDLRTSAVLKTGLDFSAYTGGATGSTRGMGIFAENGDQPNSIYSGYFATTKATGALSTGAGATNLRTNPTAGSTYNNADQSIRNTYKTADVNSDGISQVSTSLSNDFQSLMGTTGLYSGLTGVNLQPKNPLTGSVNMYLYHFDTAAGTFAQRQAPLAPGDSYIIPGTTYEGMFTLTSDGTLSYTANVPVPGAVWLLGSGLLGLVGIRRRKNS